MAYTGIAAYGPAKGQLFDAATYDYTFAMFITPIVVFILVYVAIGLVFEHTHIHNLFKNKNVGVFMEYIFPIIIGLISAYFSLGVI